jgi:hypothetical protein
MKLQYICLIFFCCVSASFVTTRDLVLLNISDDCQTIIDSAKIFVQTSEFAVNEKPTIKDPDRNLRLDKWLRMLSFKNLTCLLENKNISVKATGFMYGLNFHRDSLLKNYSYLLADTTSVQLFMTDRSTSPKMKFGELLSVLIQKIKEDNDNFAKRPEIEDLVSAFIRQYSTYPNTYKPISFPYFSMGSDDTGLNDYKIHHEYEIKNNEGVNVRVVSAFVLDKNLKINIIEKDSTSYSYSYPPKLNYWFKEFGRNLNKDDSLTLELR